MLKNITMVVSDVQRVVNAVLLKAQKISFNFYLFDYQRIKYVELLDSQQGKKALLNNASIVVSDVHRVAEAARLLISGSLLVVIQSLNNILQELVVKRGQTTVWPAEERRRC